MIEKCLNHSGGIVSGIQAVYNVYDYVEEREAALDCYSDHLCRILNLPDSLLSRSSKVGSLTVVK